MAGSGNGMLRRKKLARRALRAVRRENQVQGEEIRRGWRRLERERWWREMRERQRWREALREEGARQGVIVVCWVGCLGLGAVLFWWLS